MEIIDPKTGKAYFSKRRRRYDGDCSARELTFSCYRRLKFLDRDRTRKWFIESLHEVRKEWPVDLWAYVIMPEHAHLIVAPRRSNVDIGAFQGAIKERVARTAINWLAKNSPQWLARITVREGTRTRRRFWQPGGGYDRNVIEIATLWQMIEYLHANPLRRGLASRAVDWQWSSARWYAGLRPVDIEMDATLPMNYGR